MSTAFLSRYLEANLIVAVGYVLSLVGSRWLSPTDGRRFSTVILFLVLFFPLAGHWLPKTVIIPPKAQVWSGISIKTHKVQPKAALSIGLQKPADTNIPFGGLAWLAALILLRMDGRKAGRIWGFVDEGQAVRISKEMTKLR